MAVERYVTDRERVVACVSFFKSRFERSPGIDTISRITGLSRERIRRASLPEKTGPIGLVKTETLTCEVCGKHWERKMVRGRKPPKCPDCR